VKILKEIILGKKTAAQHKISTKNKNVSRQRLQKGEHVDDGQDEE